MDRKQLLDQTEDLTALLLAFDKLTPGHVTDEFIKFLQGLPGSPVTCDLLLSSLKMVKEQEASRGSPRQR